MDGGRIGVRRLTRLRLVFALLLVALVTLGTADAMAPQDTIYVVRQGWHPGLMLPMPLAEPLLVGELEGDRPRYVEIACCGGNCRCSRGCSRRGGCSTPTHMNVPPHERKQAG